MEVVLANSVEHERDLGSMAGTEAMVVLGGGVVEPVDPGGGACSGAGFGDPDGRDGEEPVGDDCGEDVACAGAGPTGPVEGQGIGGQPVGAGGGLQCGVVDQVDGGGRDKEQPCLVAVGSAQQAYIFAVPGGDRRQRSLRQDDAID